jgi:hypothetical protein
MREIDPRACADEGAGGMEGGALAAQRRQLLAAARRMTALVQHPSAEGGDLIAAENESLGILMCHRLRLGESETLRAPRRRLVGHVGFGNIGSDHIEGQREPGEERAAVGRGRGQDKSAHGREIGHRNKGLDADPF